MHMYDDTKLKIIDNMENRDLNHYVWTRLLVSAGKINCCGYLYITDNKGNNNLPIDNEKIEKINNH